jgi:ATP phosphoribosyltransferase
MKRNNIRIAIQKSGRLQEPALELLSSWGLEWKHENGRNLIAPCTNADVELLYVRHSDIPQYVQSGAADFGIVGKNILYEDKFDVTTLQELDFGQCNLMVAVPIDSLVKDVVGLEGERVATSYPNSLRKFLKQEKLSAAVVEIQGAVEVAPALGLADAICDITQTGSTLRANGLKQIATLFRSNAVLIESPSDNEQKNKFKRRFL